MASDSPYQNLTQYFPTCNDFIHNARVQGGNVLIHCLAGMSRSVTIVVAYVMSITSFQLSEAQKVVRGARPVSNPNSGFQKQLQEFESSSRLFEERRRMLEKYPGSTFLESDVEHCKKLLVSYNNLLLSRAICEGGCHSARVCPTGTCRTRYPLPSPRHTRLRSTECEDSVDSSTINLPKATSVSTPSTPVPVGYMRSDSSSNSTINSQSSPSKSSWERHYGCWKEHFRARQASNAAQLTCNSNPSSPVHYRVSKNHRSDSMASIDSTISIVSLPAHLQGDSYNSPTPSRSASTTNTPSSSPLVSLTFTEQNRSCPTTPRRGAVRRQLPKTGTGGSSRSLRSRQGTPGQTGIPRFHHSITPEEEDETLTVVVNEPSTSISIPSSSSSLWTTSSGSKGRIQPQVTPKRQNVTQRASTGITRWVMKRSAFRYTMDNS